MTFVLVVEDEPAIAELIAINLRHAGYEVQLAPDAEAAQRLVDQVLPDLVLLDWMLPGLSGPQTAQRWRADPRTRQLPIIMLTARADEGDKIIGLDSGADDYLTKPFSNKELLARIRAVLRRKAPEALDEAIQLGPLRVDPGTRRVAHASGDGAPVTSMIDLASGTRLVAYVAGPGATALLMATSAGYGFACTLENMLSRQKGGKQFITVDDGAQPLRPCVVDTANDDRIACLSGNGRLLVFAAAEVKQQAGGGRGVTLMALEEAEPLVGAVTCGRAGVAVSGVNRAGKPVLATISGAELRSHEGSRARKGTLLKSRLKDAQLTRPTPAARAG